MRFRRLIESSARYYAARFAEHGATPRGVDWRDDRSQQLRFDELLKVVDDPGRPFSLTDYGCGYGALAGHLDRRGLSCTYQGYDAAEELLEEAEATYAGPGRTFVATEDALDAADFVVASGVFNVKQDTDPEEWTAYVADTLRSFHRLALRGFAFNLLTSYSEPEKMRPDLFYADPAHFFDLCQREFSRHVALVHDYDLWEFTLLVRRSPRP